MRKLITFCDYCGKQIEDVYSLVPLRLLDRDRDIWEMKKDCSLPDMCLDCMVNIRSAISPEELLRKAEPVADPVADPEEGAETEQQAEEPEQKEEKPEQQAEIPEQKEKKTSAPKKKVDHGRIVALYTANPPRSIRWIADDCKCSEQTVINHLKQEGIYKTLQERREENQEEEE